ncbi:hypothetical protein KR084_004718 [Drosophila pseudotakahashii]|nr:hypothetical protein KR084_004718 [Drosophila pseudotakahashii]
MGPNSRRCLILLFIAVSFLVCNLVDTYIKQKERKFLKKPKKYKISIININFFKTAILTLYRHEIQEIQDDFVHLADSCTIEKLMVDDSQEYLRISCHVDDLPEGYVRRLKPIDYGRSFFLNQRIPKPLKRQWNFRVPTDAVNGQSLLT